MIKIKVEDKKSIVRFVGLMILLFIGAGAIYLVATKFMTFGMKYLLMSPLFGFIVCVMVLVVHYRFIVFIMSLVFGLIMSSVTIYMTIAIIMAGFLTELITSRIKPKKIKAIFAGILFSGTSVFLSLIVSKLMIGGRFESISWSWVILAAMISVILGAVGSFLGIKLVCLFKTCKSAG